MAKFNWKLANFAVRWTRIWGTNRLERCRLVNIMYDVRYHRRLVRDSNLNFVGVSGGDKTEDLPRESWGRKSLSLNSSSVSRLGSCGSYLICHTEIMALLRCISMTCLHIFLVLESWGSPSDPSGRKLVPELWHSKYHCRYWLPLLKL